MHTPADKTIILTFLSHPMLDMRMRWRVTLTFPPDSQAQTILPLVVTNGLDEPVEEATFVFAGQEIPVRAGKAGISYADFIAGKHQSALWLHRPNCSPVPGGLTFQ